MSYFPNLVFNTNDWQEAQLLTVLVRQREGQKFIGEEIQNDYLPNVGIPIIYGFQRLEPPIIFISNQFANINFLYVVIALGEGQMGTIQRLFINDVLVDFESSTDPLPHNTVTRPKIGSIYRPSSVDSDVFAEFEYIDGRGNTESNLLKDIYRSAPVPGPTRFNNLAYLVCKFRFNENLYRGRPKITVDMFGIRHRTMANFNSAGDFSGTLVVNYNPVDHLLDYMTNTRYGAGIELDKIDLETFRGVYDYIETTLVKENALSPGVPYLQQSITIDPKVPVSNNITDMTGVFGLLLSYVNGQYRLELEGQTSTTYAVTESDIVGQMLISTPNNTNKFNSMNVDYIDSLANFVRRTQTWPVPTAGVSEFARQDGNLNRAGRLETKNIGLSWLALQIAKTQLLKSRQQKLYRFIMTKRGYQFSVGDVLSVTTTVPSLTNVLMRIIRMRVREDFTIEIEAVSHDNDIYPPFADIKPSSGRLDNAFQPVVILPTPYEQPPQGPGSPSPTPSPGIGDPGGPVPIIILDEPKPTYFIQIDPITAESTSLSRGGTTTPYPTIPGNNDFYLGQVYLEQTYEDDPWSSRWPNNTQLTFKPLGYRGEFNFYPTNNQTTPGANGYIPFSFGVVVYAYTQTPRGYGGPAVIKYSPVITYRYMDSSLGAESDVTNGRYRGLDRLYFVYSMRQQETSPFATTQFGFQENVGNGRITEYYFDLERTREVQYITSQGERGTTDYAKLLTRMPIMPFYRNASGYAGGHYGETNLAYAGDGRTHAQLVLSPNVQTNVFIPCEIPSRIGFSGTATYRDSSTKVLGITRPIRFKIFAVTDSSKGLPIYLGEVGSFNSIDLCGAPGVRDEYRTDAVTALNFISNNIVDIGTWP